MARPKDPRETIRRRLASRSRGRGMGERVPQPLASALARAYDELETRLAGVTAMTGVPSGMPALDEVTGGWQPGQLIALAGAPGIGATSLLLSFARAAAIVERRPTLLISLDQSEAAILQRLIAAEAQVPLARVANASFRSEDWARLATTVERITDAPLYVDDAPNLTSDGLLRRVIRAREEHSIDLVLVDRADLLIHNAWSAHDGVAFLGQLKNLAAHLDVPIVAICQLAVNPSSPPSHRPRLSDLRRVDHTLEERADIALLLYRRAVYEWRYVPYDDAELIVAKHGRGATASVSINAQLHYGRFAAKPGQPEDPIRQLLHRPAQPSNS